MSIGTIKIRVPFWINADIINGPVNATTKPLDAGRFLKMAKKYFPDAMLSVGWTTRQGPFKLILYYFVFERKDFFFIVLRFGPDLIACPPKIIQEGSYSHEHMQFLVNALKEAEIFQQVTFPIRAGLATSSESQKNIIWLLDQVRIIYGLLNCS